MQGKYQEHSAEIFMSSSYAKHTFFVGKIWFQNFQLFWIAPVVVCYLQKCLTLGFFDKFIQIELEISEISSSTIPHLLVLMWWFYVYDGFDVNSYFTACISYIRGFFCRCSLIPLKPLVLNGSGDYFTPSQHVLHLEVNFITNSSCGVPLVHAFFLLD